MYLPEPEEEAHKPLDQEQLHSIVRRLDKCIREYLSQGEKIKVEITPEDLFQVLDQVILEAKGEIQEMKIPETPEGYFLQGLFEELVQQPSNIFETITEADGRSYYQPMKPKNWIQCLLFFKKTLADSLEPSSDSPSSSSNTDSSKATDQTPSSSQPSPVGNIQQLFKRK